MNTGFLDAQNLAWKIHVVERGFASRSILATYEHERMHVAKRLLDFDASYNKLFSERRQNNNGGQPEDDDFVKAFWKACDFTSGYGVTYPPNVLNLDHTHPLPANALLSSAYPAKTTLRAGTLFPTADVTRVIDNSTVHLKQAVPFNGAFRIYVFAGQATKAGIPAALADFARFSLQKDSYYSSFPPVQNVGTGNVGSHCPHLPIYSFCTIFALRRSDIDIDKMVPGLLRSDRSQVYADDAAGEGTTHDMAHRRMGTAEDSPAVVVVRPDGYIGCIVRLVEGSATVAVLNAYFGRFVTRDIGSRLEEEGLAGIDVPVLRP